MTSFSFRPRMGWAGALALAALVIALVIALPGAAEAGPANGSRQAHSAPSVTALFVTEASASVAVGLTDQCTAIAAYSDGTTADVTGTAAWSSDNAPVAAVDGGGLATGGAVGTAHVTAALSGVTSTPVPLTVTPAVVTFVSLTAASASVLPGGMDQFAATAYYSDSSARDVTGTAAWASDDTGAATINAAGLAAGVAEGMADITATVGGVTSAPFLLTVHTPGTRTVTDALDDASSGCLRSVLASAGPGDTLTFAPGVTGAITLNGTELEISRDVTIVGPGADLLAIDAGGLSRVFDISGGTVALSGLTLQNGNALGDSGGGILNAGALTVTGCVFTGDSADYGGGLYNDYGGVLTLTGSTFSGDTATDYGGAIDSQQALTIVNSTFCGNTASYGSALLNAGPLALTSSTFSGNTATAAGVIYNIGQATLTATLLTGSVGGDFVNGSGGAVMSGGSNLLGDSDGSGFVNGAHHDQTGVSAAAAKIGPLTANGGHTPTCAVLPGSPAIGGDYALQTATDQRGVARTAARHTVGAFEFVAAPLVPIRTHVLWNNADGRAMLWNVDAQGNETAHVFGPYTDDSVGSDPSVNKWYATALATGPDGLSHLLWNNTDGRVMLWTVDDSGNFTLAGYGPYTDNAPQNKWHATAVSVGPDNVTHLLWNNTDHRVMLWNVDSAFNFALAGYGPYTDTFVSSDPGNLWSATALATGPDNLSRIAWNNTDGRVMLWNVDSAFDFTLAGYGPYTDNAPQNKWHAVGVSAGPDNITHLLWSNTDRRAMFWNVDSSFNFTLAGFGPYTDNSVGTDPSVNLWAATGLATGGDNLSRVLWANTDSRMMLWDVGSGFGFTVAGYGPYTDLLPGGATGGQWSAIAVSAAP